MRGFWVNDAKAAQRAAEKADAEERAANRREEADRLRLEKAFNDSPAGQARNSYLRDDHLFQINIDLTDITSTEVPTGDGIAIREAAYISEVINSVVSQKGGISTPSRPRWSLGGKRRSTVAR